MILSYFPPSKISIDDVVLGFNESRELIRKKLTGDYKEDNQIIQMGSSDIEPIYQRRDIYQNYNSTESFFFLGYDEGDLLSEIEVHWCNEIKVFDAVFSFNDSLDSVALKLDRYSPISSRSEGEYFFEELKIVIMDKDKMGGEGKALGYFYCASDVTHLIGQKAASVVYQMRRFSMRYLQVPCIHDFDDEPISLYSEMDDRGYEVRKIEIYKDGSFGVASPEKDFGGTLLSPEPSPILKK